MDTQMTLSENTTERILRQDNAQHLEHYRGYDIYNQRGSIVVANIKEDTLFVVALDDSKRSGRRVMVESANTIDSARHYIDGTVKYRVESEFRALRTTYKALKSMDGTKSYYDLYEALNVRLRAFLRMDVWELDKEPLLELCAMVQSMRPVALHSFLITLTSKVTF